MIQINKKHFKPILLAVFTLTLLGAGALWYFSRGNVQGVSAGWWNDNWSYRKQIVINSDYVTGDLTDFPVLISFTDAQVASHTQATGGDIVFIDSEGKKLSHEIESFATSSTGAFVGWVKIPSLSSTEDTVLSMYYGNQGIGNQESAESVWDDNYVGVWHMPDDANASTSDSTRYDNNGTATGSPSLSSSGKIDGALWFDDANEDRIDIDQSSSLNNLTTFTLSAWVRLDDFGGGSKGRLFQKDGAFKWWLEGPSNNIYFEAERWDTDGQWDTDDSLLETDQWTYLTVRYDYSNPPDFYINGSPVNDIERAAPGGGLNSETSDLHIGNRSTYGRGFDGQLDELRISNTIRSVDWINTSYINQASTTLFLSVQAEETGPGPVGYWSFDTGYGTTANDESGQGNDGTITGALWQDESMCVSGKCLYFDGDGDYVDLGAETTFEGNTEGTISAWVKLSSTTKSTIIGYGGQDVAQPGLLTLEQTDIEYSRLQIVQMDDAHGGIYHQVGTTIDLYDNSWHHIAMMSDGDQYILYVDGNLQAINASYGSNLGEWFGDTDIGSPQAASIGALFYDGSYTNYMTGYIDEVKIYPYARSADEIRQDYAAGLAGIKSNSGVAASFGSQSDSWMSDGLVGYWNLDEPSSDSSYADSSGNSNTGTASGNASTTAGKFGNGGVFDGSGDYVDCGNGSILNIGDDKLTISAWIYVGETPSDIMGIAAKSAAQSGGYRLSIINSGNGVPSLQIHNGATISCTGSNAITLGEWNHVVGVYDGNQIMIYLNSVQDPIITNTNGNLTLSADDLWIGHGDQVTGESWSYPFDGQIDEVRIYNRALSPREVRQLYEWAPGPVAYWKFDELAGDTAYDSVASSSTQGGNDGDLGSSGDACPAYTSTNNCPSWTRGKYGSALEFDGSDDYVDVTDDGTSIGMNNSAGTIVAWFKADEQLNHSGWYRGQPFAHRSGVDDNKILFQVQGSAGVGGGDFSCGFGDENEAITTDNNVENDGLWHFAVLTWQDGDTAECYLDGISMGTYVFTLPTLDGNVNIGRQGTADYWEFAGKIDDVRIYNYALTQKQILAVMNGSGPETSHGSSLQMPVLDLSFDEGYGDWAYDSSVHANHGYLQHGGSGDNDATSSMWDLNGKFGKAMEFDGTDDVLDLTSAATLDSVMDSMEPISYSLWLKSRSAGGSDNSRIIGKMDGNNRSRGLLHYDTNARLYFQTAGDTWQNRVMAANSIVYGQWHHVVVTWDGTLPYTAIKMYVDGKEVEYDDALSQNGVNLNDGDAWGFYIGDRDDGGRTFDGLMDEVKVFNYVLSEDEINTLYNGGVSATMGAGSTATTSDGVHVPSNAASRTYCVPGSDDYCAAPVLELKFDELTGTTTYDTSGNGNDGVFVNAATSPTWDRGKYGSALRFDGSNDYVDLGGADLIPEDDDFTINIWAKHSVNSSSVSFGGGGDSGETWSIQIRWSAAYAVANSTQVTLDYPNQSDNKWHYYTIVRDGNTWQAYIDGQYQVQASQAGNVRGSSGGYVEKTIVGGRWNEGALDLPLEGMTDNATVYQYARTPAQIAWDYNRGKPVAHWKFDECSGSTILDWAPGADGNAANANPGQLHLGTTGVTATGTCASSSNSFWYNGRSGKYNSTGDFDGVSDYIEIGDNSDLEFTSASAQMTISAWIYPNSDTGDRSILTKYDSQADEIEYALFLDYTNLDLNFWLSEDGSGAAGELWKTNTSENVVRLDEWQHVVVTMELESNTIAYYINGINYASINYQKTGITDMSDLTEPVRVGSMRCGTGSICGFFSGFIDEVKIYNYALTSEQVRNEYNGGAVRFGN